MQKMRFEEEEPQKSQFLSEDEANAVIELWAERQKEREKQRSMPTVQQLAASLDITLEEAQTLLNEVRSRQNIPHSQTPPVYAGAAAPTITQTPPVHPAVQRRRRRSRLIGQTFFALFFAFCALLFLSFFFVRINHVPSSPSVAFYDGPVITVPSTDNPAAILQEQAAALEHQASQLESQIQDQEAQLRELNEQMNRVRGQHELLAKRERVKAVLTGLREQARQLQRQSQELRRQADRIRQSPPMPAPTAPSAPVVPN
jgi:hypothetical protein